jgi:hypothetical protein
MDALKSRVGTAEELIDAESKTLLELAEAKDA